MAAVPLFAQHSGVFLEVAADDGVDDHALAEEVALQQAAVGQR